MTTLQDWYDDYLRRGKFIRRYPLYAHVLARFEVFDDPRVNVMAVSTLGVRFRLHVNVSFFEKGPQFLPGVLLHEVHHIVLGHLTDPRYRGVAFPDLMELAMEMSANEFIRELLPGEPVTWKAFSDLGAGPGQSTMERYNHLAAARRRSEFPGPYLCASVDDHGPAELGSDQTLDGREGAALALKRLLAEIASTEASKHHDRPTGEPETRLAGRSPGELTEMLPLDEAIEPAGLNWQAVLRQFTGSLVSPGFVYHRPNRRFPDRIGEVPGRSRLGGTRRLRLMTVIDTSGSMRRGVLASIAREINELAIGSAVTVVECDAEIQRVYAGGQRIEAVRGRGGTDLRPPFDPSFLRVHRPDGLIYFTDGCGPYLAEPPEVDTLWVLTGSTAFRCPWGKRTYLRRANRYSSGYRSRMARGKKSLLENVEVSMAAGDFASHS